MGLGIDEFRAASEIIERDHPAVRRLAAEVQRQTELQTIRAAYETVRDRFPHSYDIGAEEVSVSASDVIRHGHGICFAKSHLLAAVCEPAASRPHCAISAYVIATTTRRRPACTGLTPFG